jgi:hypothetical protein
MVFSMFVMASALPGNIALARGHRAGSVVAATALAPIIPIAAAVPAGSLCVTFIYDKNGNRIAQTVNTAPSGSVTWGSVRYGCFAWSN